MTRLFFILYFLIFFSPCCLPQHISAVSTEDNDLSLGNYPAGDTIAVPEAVAYLIDTVAYRVYEDRNSGIDSTDPTFTPLRFFYGPTFRISTPSGLQLYIFKQKDLFGMGFYYFMLFDPRTNTVTVNPLRIYTKWMDSDEEWGGKLVKPLVRFLDLDRDGKPELVVQERVHNGTVYNAVVFHYFRIMPDLSLKQIIALETNLIDLHTMSSCGIIERQIRSISRDSLVIESFLNLNGKSKKKLGEALLCRNSPDSFYRVQKRIALNSKYASLLITAWSEDENKFLREGYTFYY